MLLVTVAENWSLALQRTSAICLCYNVWLPTYNFLCRGCHPSVGLQTHTHTHLSRPQSTRVWRHVIQTLGCDITHYVICNHRVCLIQQRWSPFQLRNNRTALTSKRDHKKVYSFSRVKFIEYQRSNLIGCMQGCMSHSRIWLMTALFFGTFVLCGARPFWVGVGLRLHTHHI